MTLTKDCAVLSTRQNCIMGMVAKPLLLSKKALFRIGMNCTIITSHSDRMMDAPTTGGNSATKSLSTSSFISEALARTASA